MGDTRASSSWSANEPERPGACDLTRGVSGSTLALAGMATVVCQRCERSIGPQDWEPKSGLAQCQACGLVFERLVKPDAPESRPIGRKRERIELPPRVYAELVDPIPLPRAPAAIVPYRDAATERQPAPRADACALIRVHGGMERRFDAAVIPGASLMVTGFVGGVLKLTGGFDGLASFCLGIAALLGAFVAWQLAAAYLNDVTVRLANGLLEVVVGPVPTGGNRRVPAGDIEQIWTRRTVTVVKESKGKTRPRIEYNVELRLKSKKTVVLVRGLDVADHALYIEQALEHALGIIDVAVFDEGRSDPGDRP